MFIDREDAGRQLAQQLQESEYHAPLVLAIPRGGLVTGDVLAKALDADLDVILSRKLRAPHQAELAIGAVGEDGNVYLDRELEATIGVDQEYLDAERQYQLQEIARRQTLFRSIRPAAPIRGRSVILTDDGIATGSTMMAALGTLKTQQALEVIVAVPVAPPDRLLALRDHCDRVICLLSPADFCAVGQFYQSFDAIEDQQVVNILRQYGPTDGSKDSI